MEAYEVPCSSIASHGERPMTIDDFCILIYHMIYQIRWWYLYIFIVPKQTVGFPEGIYLMWFFFGLLGFWLLTLRGRQEFTRRPELSKFGDGSEKSTSASRSGAFSDNPGPSKSPSRAVCPKALPRRAVCLKDLLRKMPVAVFFRDIMQFALLMPTFLCSVRVSTLYVRQTTLSKGYGTEWDRKQVTRWYEAFSKWWPKFERT